MTEVQPVPKQTLPEILDRRARLTSQLDDTTDELIRALDDNLADLNIKIDDYKDAILANEARISYLDAKIGHIQEIKDFYRNQIGAIESKLEYFMLSRGYEKLPGEIYEASILISERVDIDEAVAKPDAALYNHFPDYITRSYGWDKNKIKVGIKKGVFAHDNIRISRHPNLQLEPKKELRSGKPKTIRATAKSITGDEGSSET